MAGKEKKGQLGKSKSNPLKPSKKEEQRARQAKSLPLDDQPEKPFEEQDEFKEVGIRTSNKDVGKKGNATAIRGADEVPGTSKSMVPPPPGTSKSMVPPGTLTLEDQKKRRSTDLEALKHQYRPQREDKTTATTTGKCKAPPDFRSTPLFRTSKCGLEQYPSQFPPPYYPYAGAFRNQQTFRVDSENFPKRYRVYCDGEIIDMPGLPFGNDKGLGPKSDDCYTSDGRKLSAKEKRTMTIEQMYDQVKTTKYADNKMKWDTEMMTVENKRALRKQQRCCAEQQENQIPDDDEKRWIVEYVYALENANFFGEGEDARCRKQTFIEKLMEDSKEEQTTGCKRPPVKPSFPPWVEDEVKTMREQGYFDKKTDYQCREQIMVDRIMEHRKSRTRNDPRRCDDECQQMSAQRRQEMEQEKIIEIVDKLGDCGFFGNDKDSYSKKYEMMTTLLLRQREKQNNSRGGGNCNNKEKPIVSFEEWVRRTAGLLESNGFFGDESACCNNRKEIFVKDMLRQQECRGSNDVADYEARGDKFTKLKGTNVTGRNTYDTLEDMCAGELLEDVEKWIVIDTADLLGSSSSRKSKVIGGLQGFAKNKQRDIDMQQGDNNCDDSLEWILDTVEKLEAKGFFGQGPGRNKLKTEFVMDSMIKEKAQRTQKSMGDGCNGMKRRHGSGASRSEKRVSDACQQVTSVPIFRKVQELDETPGKQICRSADLGRGQLNEQKPNQAKHMLDTNRSGEANQLLNPILPKGKGHNMKDITNTENIFKDEGFLGDGPACACKKPTSISRMMTRLQQKGQCHADGISEHQKAICNILDVTNLLNGMNFFGAEEEDERLRRKLDFTAAMLERHEQQLRKGEAESGIDVFFDLGDILEMEGFFGDGSDRGCRKSNFIGLLLERQERQNQQPRQDRIQRIVGIADLLERKCFFETKEGSLCKKPIFIAVVLLECQQDDPLDGSWITNVADLLESICFFGEGAEGGRKKCKFITILSEHLKEQKQKRCVPTGNKIITDKDGKSDCPRISKSASQRSSRQTAEEKRKFVNEFTEELDRKGSFGEGDYRTCAITSFRESLCELLEDLPDSNENRRLKWKRLGKSLAGFLKKQCRTEEKCSNEQSNRRSGKVVNCKQGLEPDCQQKEPIFDQPNLKPNCCKQVIQKKETRSLDENPCGQHQQKRGCDQQDLKKTSSKQRICCPKKQEVVCSQQKQQAKVATNQSDVCSKIRVAESQREKEEKPCCRQQQQGTLSTDQPNVVKKTKCMRKEEEQDCRKQKQHEKGNQKSRKRFTTDVPDKRTETKPPEQHFGVTGREEKWAIDSIHEAKSQRRYGYDSFANECRKFSSAAYRFERFGVCAGRNRNANELLENLDDGQCRKDDENLENQPGLGKQQCGYRGHKMGKLKDLDDQILEEACQLRQDHGDDTETTESLEGEAKISCWDREKCPDGPTAKSRQFITDTANELEKCELFGGQGDERDMRARLLASVAPSSSPQQGILHTADVVPESLGFLGWKPDKYRKSSDVAYPIIMTKDRSTACDLPQDNNSSDAGDTDDDDGHFSPVHQEQSDANCNDVGYLGYYKLFTEFLQRDKGVAMGQRNTEDMSELLPSELAQIETGLEQNKARPQNISLNRIDLHETDQTKTAILMGVLRAMRNGVGSQEKLSFVWKGPQRRFVIPEIRLPLQGTMSRRTEVDQQQIVFRCAPEPRLRRGSYDES